MKLWEKIVLGLGIVGNLAWGVYGIWNVNLIESILGVKTIASMIIFDGVGIVGLYTIYHLWKK